MRLLNIVSIYHAWTERLGYRLRKKRSYDLSDLYSLKKEELANWRYQGILNCSPTPKMIND